MRTLGRAAAWTAAGLALLPALAACGGGPAYTFVSNDDHDAVLRIPASWDHISVNAAMRAAGQKKATTEGWLAYYDGATEPSALHATASVTAAPILEARSLDIPEESREGITKDVLLDVLNPVTEAGKAQLPAAAAASITIKKLTETTISTSTATGVHVLFSYTIGGYTEVFDKIAVTDPDRSRLHVVVVHCSQACFASRGEEIDRTVSSLTVKKT